MNVQEARSIATERAGSLTTFLHGVFGDAATAEKFARFALQRLEVDFDEIEGDGVAALFILGREVCREYVSSATFARLPLAAGDEGLPVAGVLPAAPAELVAALPRAARLALRLAIVDGLAARDVAAVMGCDAARVARLVERVAAVAPAAKLAGALDDVAALVAADPVPVAEAPAAQTIVPGGRRTTRRTAITAADSGSVPRGVSLSPLVPGGHPANRGNSPYTRPFPTRQVAALKPASSNKSAIVAACTLAFVLLAGGPLSGYLGKAKPEPVKAAAPVTVAAVVAPSCVPGSIGTVELPGRQLPLMPGQEVVAPARGEAHVRISHVEIWLQATSRAQVWADRVVLLDGVARVQVDSSMTYLGLAEPLELKLSGGTYLLRRGDKRGTGLCTLAGLAEVTGKAGRGMRAEAGRTIAMGRDGAEARDTSDRLDDTEWGREAARVAKSVADASHFSALPAGAPEMTLAAAATSGAGGRALFASTGAKAVAMAADRGAAGYRQAF